MVLLSMQGGGTPIFSVLRAATAVKLFVKSQVEKNAAVKSQRTVSHCKVVNSQGKSQINENFWMEANI